MPDQLIAKVAKAALDVGGKLSADKTNKDQNYDYISADKILSIAGQALFSQGVIIIPNIGQQDTVLFEYVDAYGKAKKRYDSTVTFQFTITDGVTDLRQNWYGVGSDYAVPDKALYKAITSGHKYFLMKLLCIGAGNEDGEHEEDDDGKGKKPIPPKQQAQQAQTQPPAKKPEPVKATEPAKTDAIPSGKALEEAEAEYSESQHMLYGQIPTEKLAVMRLGMKKVHAPTPDQARKIAAVDTILAARAHGRAVQVVEPDPTPTGKAADAWIDNPQGEEH
jgi:hypothetical protein